MTNSNAVREIADCLPENIEETVESLSMPLVLRGIVSTWPAVRASEQSSGTLAGYLQRFYSGDNLTTFVAPADIQGRVAYNDDFSGFNFERTSLLLEEVLEHLSEFTGEDSQPAIYVGSTLLDRWFPGFREENDLPLNHLNPLASIWLGNQIRVSAHFDVPDNIACCVCGRRRFTLFPPDQLENLYVGPWDVTPAGQAISLVDFRNPDLDRYPRFADAMANASVVTLEPGDALFVPSMWWHHVEGLDDFNVLVNYWWRSTPRYMGAPLSVLKHALLGLRDLPLEQRLAWRNIFDYYIFNRDESATAHIPPQRRGILSEMDEDQARRVRADLLNLLNR